MIKITMTKEVWSVLKNNCGTDKTRRAFCKTILTQNNSVYATDCRRAVKFSIDRFSCSEPLKDNGVYELVSEVKAKASAFVDVYFELLPDLEPPDFSCVWINGERKEVLAVDVKSKNAHSLSLAVIKIFDQTKRAINYEFIDALLYRQKYPSCLKVFVKEGQEQASDKTLLITSADIPFEAIVLPIRMDGAK